MARSCRDWIETYLQYTEHTEAPASFHKWTAISTVASALRRHVWLPMGHFEWVPNFFVFLVAPAGIVSKSTTASIGMDLLDFLQDLEGIKFGPSVVTWQALMQSMAESRVDFPLPDNEGFMPMCAITILASELGTFFNPKDRDLVDILVDLWDGKRGKIKKLTKHDEDIILNPCINLIACTTPTWISENVGEYFIGGGFASRSVFVYEEQKRRLIAYPTELMDQSKLDKIKEKLLHDLSEIAQLVGPYKLTPEAIEWGTGWYEYHNTNPHELLFGEKFSSYLARKQTHMHKLAMIRSASLRDELVIHASDLRWSEQQLNEMEEDLPKVFRGMNREKEMTMADEVLDYIRRKKKIEKTVLYDHFRRSLSFDTFDGKILNSLLNAGQLTMRQEGTGLFVCYIGGATEEEKERQSYG